MIRRAKPTYLLSSIRLDHTHDQRIRPRLATTALFACLLLPLASPALADGILQQLRQDARHVDSSPVDSQQRRENYNFDQADNSYAATGDTNLLAGMVTSLLGPPLLYVIATPIWGPRALLGDDKHSTGYFLDYPYKDSSHAAMVIDPPGRVGRREYSGTARFEYGEDFDNLSMLSSHFLLRGKNRLGVDAGFDYRREDLGPGQFDHLWTGTVNVVTRFAQNENTQMYLGIGANWLDDDLDTEWGVNLTYGGDWQLSRPWVMSLDLDLGKVGTATVSHFRWTIGVMVRRYEVYLGFDHYRFGRVDLDQMVSGIRVWF